jgi:hypothetical protein
MKGVTAMKLRFSTRAFMDREQDSLLVTYQPFRITVLKAGEAFDSILSDQIKAPYVMHGESGDAAIGGFKKLNDKLRQLMIEHTVKIIEENREKGLRTGIVSVVSPSSKAERGSLMLLTAYPPDDEHVAEQKDFTDYRTIIEDFFNENPGVYY